MWVDPRLGVDATATASVSVVVAEAGVGADVNVFHFDTYAEASTSAYDPCAGVTGSPVLMFTCKEHVGLLTAAYGRRKLYFARNTYAGGGELYAFVTVYYPCAHWPPYCSTEYDYTILDWDGFQSAAVEVNRQRSDIKLLGQPSP